MASSQTYVASILLAVLAWQAWYIPVNEVLHVTQIDGVGFSGSALMFIYHVGVAQEIIKAKAYTPGITPAAGTSGGSYMAVATTSGTTTDELYTAVESMYNEMHAEEEACREANPNEDAIKCSISAGKMVRYQYKLLGRIISTAHWERVQNTAFVHVTLVTSDIPYEPYPEALCEKAAYANQTVSQFTSRDDVIDACVASSYFSYLSSPNCTMKFRGQNAVDGGYTVHLPCPPRSEHCLKIEALMPYDAEENEKCTAPQVPGSSAPADIYPGYSGLQLPLGYCDWGAAAVNVSLIFNNYKAIYAVARADAKKWLEDHGWA